MKFLVRDDDTCAFTSPEELRECYESVWCKVPINLSITPFRIPGNSHTVPPAYQGCMKPIALHENHELLSFLKEKYQDGKLNFALHGYNHTKPKGLPEYVGETGLYDKTKKGKGYLEKILGVSAINTFVPPNNGIGREGFEAIVKNGLNLVGIPPLLKPRYRTVRPENIFKYVRVKYYMDIKRMALPSVLRFSDHSEVGYYSVTPSQTFQSLLHGFHECRKRDGVFIFAVHYHAFDKKLKTGERIRDVLHIFLEMANKVKGIRFLTYKQLWHSDNF